MKTNDSLVGGRLKDDPRVYDAYARYLVKFVQAYERAGVPIDALTVQNEPQNRKPSGYPGTDMPVAQQAKLIEALGPMLRAAGSARRSSATTTTGPTHPNDVAHDAARRGPRDRLPDEAAATAGRAVDRRHRLPLLLRRPERARPRCTTRSRDKGIWFTECSGSHGATDPPAQFFRDTLNWHARNLMIGVTRNWAKSVVNWNLALRLRRRPAQRRLRHLHRRVTVGPGGTVTTNAEYYTIGHLAQFVQPGAVRIASTSFGTTGWNGQIMDVAFRNPDGSTALVVHNENDDPRTFAVAAGGTTFEYTLPGGALATFSGRPRALDDGYRLLDRDRLGEARTARGRRRRHHPLEPARRRRRPVAPGRPRPQAARAPRRPRQRRRHRRLPARLHPARQRRRLALARGRRRRHLAS